MTDGICVAGLDVHARKTAAAAVQLGSGEVSAAAGSSRATIEWLRSLPGPVRAVCEAGPTGFGLARDDTRHRVSCVSRARQHAGGHSLRVSSLSSWLRARRLSSDGCDWFSGWRRADSRVSCRRWSDPQKLLSPVAARGPSA
jgi:hypothetical protein